MACSVVFHYEGNVFLKQEIYTDVFIHPWCIEKEIQRHMLCLDLKYPVVRRDFVLG